jgi:Tfp pilus assembly protein PilF
MAKFHDSARECFTRALALDPQLDRLWVKLGEVEIEAQRPPAAQVAFERALALNSQNDAALAGLGNIAYRAGEKRAAHDYFARSLSINIHNPGAVFCLVKCAYETKNYAIAARFLEQYAQSAPINANLLYSLAGLHYHLGRMEQAGALAAQILELKPDHEGAKELLQLIGKLSVMEDRCQSTQIP